jgi:hypothetical protein
MTTEMTFTKEATYNFAYENATLAYDVYRSDVSGDDRLYVQNGSFYDAIEGKATGSNYRVVDMDVLATQVYEYTRDDPASNAIVHEKQVRFISKEGNLTFDVLYDFYEAFNESDGTTPMYPATESLTVLKVTYKG